MANTNPHDALFKATFSAPRRAADVLRRQPPPDVADRIDWSTLERVPAESIGQDLTARRADLIFRARIGEQTAFFLLFEHQSSVDPLMPVRVYIYISRIWEGWLREHPNAGYVPAVLPVVLYHGERPWTAPLDLHALFDLPDPLKAGLGPHLPALRLLVDDLTRSSEDEIEASTRDALVTCCLLALKTAAYGSKHVIPDRLIEHLNRAARAEEVMDGVVQTLHYLYRLRKEITRTARA